MALEHNHYNELFILITATPCTLQQLHVMYSALYYTEKSPLKQKNAKKERKNVGNKKKHKKVKKKSSN